MSFVNVALTGTVESSPGNPVQGATVTASLSHTISDGTSDVGIAPVSTQTASNGTFSLTVQANDSEGLLPVGTFYYFVITSTTGATLDSFSAIVPSASAPSTNLFSLARLGNAPPPATPFVSSLEGLNGAVAFTSPDESVAIGTDGNQITLEAASGGGVESFNERTGEVTLEESDIKPLGTLIPNDFLYLTTPLPGGVYQSSVGQLVIINDAAGNGGTVYLPTVESAGVGGMVAIKATTNGGQYIHLLVNTSDSGVTINDGLYTNLSTQSPHSSTLLMMCDGSNWQVVGGSYADSGYSYWQWY